MKNSVKVAYWDITASQTPRLIGQVQGTPTIKFLYPSKKNSPKSNKKKIVSDYNGERKWKDMAEYAVSRMPNFVVRIKDAKTFAAYEEKAYKYALPKVLVFSEKPTSKIIKALSTEYRRRALIADVRASKNNKELVEKFGVTKFPAVIALKDDGEHVRMEKKPTWNRLNNFMSDHALKKPYFMDKEALATIEKRKAEKGEKAEL